MLERAETRAGAEISASANFWKFFAPLSSAGSRMMRWVVVRNRDTLWMILPGSSHGGLKDPPPDVMRVAVLVIQTQSGNVIDHYDEQHPCSKKVQT